MLGFEWPSRKEQPQPPEMDRVALRSVVADIIRGLPSEAQQEVLKRLDRMRTKDWERENRSAGKDRTVLARQFLDKNPAVTLHSAKGHSDVWLHHGLIRGHVRKMSERLSVYEMEAPMEETLVRAVTTWVQMHEYMHGIAYKKHGTYEGLAYIEHSGFKDRSDPFKVLYSSLDEAITEKLAREATRAYFERVGDRKALKAIEFLNARPESFTFIMYSARQFDIDTLSALMNVMAAQWEGTPDMIWGGLVQGYLNDPQATVKTLMETFGEEDATRAGTILLEALKAGHPPEHLMKELVSIVNHLHLMYPAAEFFTRLGLSQSLAGQARYGGETR